MRAALPLACAALLAIGVTTDALAIVRCEAANGRVTYSNTDCPPGTKEVRKVDESPPVVVHDGTQSAAKDSEPRPPARIEAAKPRRQADPLQQDRELTAQIAAQRRDCEQRARQLQHLQADLNAASEANRSSAELALRRAQDEYQTVCGKLR
jgi:Tfp pilus assembly protein FimV